jgi:hypothetical protein
MHKFTENRKQNKRLVEQYYQTNPDRNLAKNQLKKELTKVCREFKPREIRTFGKVVEHSYNFEDQKKIGKYFRPLYCHVRHPKDCKMIYRYMLGIQLIGELYQSFRSFPL